MNVTVYANSYDWLFDNPQADVFERAWSMGRYAPPVEVGDELIFRWKNAIVARAICCAITAPGERDCLMHDGTRVLKGYKVHWRPSTFEDLRSKPDIVAEIERAQRDARSRRKKAAAHP